MAKINRYTGDLKAFASNSTGTNRTVFGDVTQSDALDDNVNADYLLGWEMVGVNDKPDREDFNGLGFTLGQIHAYIHQMGVPEWDSLQEFPATGITNKNGAFYISQQIHTGQDPELDTTNTYWSNPLDMSEFFTDSGVADAYVFAPSDGKPRPIAYTDGLKVSAVITNACTGGAVTAEITGIAGGGKPVKLSGGTDPAAGDIDGRTELVYDLANDWFELILAPTGLAVYDTGEISIVSTGAGTVSHGLPSKPIIIQCFLKCIVAHSNHAVGDLVPISGAAQSTEAISKGVDVVLPNDTQIKWRFGINSNTFNLLDQTTGGGVEITNTSWKFILKAYSI